jgi:5'-phosphate synthase pdxT subunit
MAPHRVGVLALQGDFKEHIEVLTRIEGVNPVEVRLPKDLEGLRGLIIPGGESTTIGKLMVDFDLLEPIRQRALHGMPLWGTCAGLIVMAREIVGGTDQPLLGLMDVRVRRNAFGRQVDSFEADLFIPSLGEQPFHAVFIRAPYIEAVGHSVEVLASLPDGTVVAARQGNLLGTSFHPELTEDTRFHEYFLAMG